MKQFLHRTWLTILAIKNFLYRFLLQPLAKITYNQRQQKQNSFKAFNWRKAKPADFTFLIKGAVRLGLIAVLGVFIFYLIVYFGFLGSLPSRSDLRSRQNNTASEVYSADGVLLGRYYIQDRTNVTFNKISPNVIQALIATEDARFYEHNGIDPRSLLRVLFKTILFQEESSGGGSTLSQQLAKNLYPRKNYWFFSTPINKLREYIIARRLEKVYSKQEILELYLNTVPMGGDLYGIERAARRFFNTSADSIKLEEAAVLVGMLKATTTYNPRLNLEKSRQRRNVVLNQMVKYEYISAQKASELKEKPIELKYRYETHNDGLAPYFREQLRLELVKWCATQQKEDGTPYNLYTDGLKIYTTIHAGMQAKAEKAVKKHMFRLQKLFNSHWQGRSPWGNKSEVIKTAMQRSDRYKKLKAAGLAETEITEKFKEPVPMQVFSWQEITRKTMSPLDSLRYYQKYLNTGLFAMEPHTGYVRTWVGGINHTFFKYDHVRSKRQVGSTFKPILYATALERGIAPCTYFQNKLTTYSDYENWTPRNADGQYGGEYSMRGALAHSVNTISAQLIMQTGIEPVISTASRLGIQTKLPQVPALALGTAELSLFEMVNAYATLANNGYRVKPTYITKIVDRKEKVIFQHNTRESMAKAMSSDVAAIMIELLKGVVEEGTAGRVRSEFNLSMEIAGKTGTTQNHSDGWFIGITPDLVTGVWVGAENPSVRFRTLELGQGSHTALPIWGEFMSQVIKDPYFKDYRYSRFKPLPAMLQSSLLCDGFISNRPEPIIREATFLGRFFDRIKEKRKKKREKKERKKFGKWIRGE